MYVIQHMQGKDAMGRGDGTFLWSMVNILGDMTFSNIISVKNIFYQLFRVESSETTDSIYSFGMAMERFFS